MPTPEEIKKSGATFTPARLAAFLANKILKYSKGARISVLDPACGEGELLVSMGEKLIELGIDFSLTGYDTNSNYLELTNERLLKFRRDRYALKQLDFLRIVNSDSFDVIIANPPYVRTQILGSDLAQNLAKRFNLKGRVDLYYPFLMAMTESLKDGGILGVITSNRYLFTKSGDSVRKYLAENYSILELIDLGDTKLFEAAVLPAIFVGRKGNQKGGTSSRFSKIYEELNGHGNVSKNVESIYDVIHASDSGHYSVGQKKYKKTDGVLKYSTSAWEMLSSDESDWISTIEKNSVCRVGDLFKVRVGIKTTADKVFISDTWNELGDDKPEPELLKELLSQENIEAWGATENLNLKVLYPHVNERNVKKTVDLDKFPSAKKYFHQHEQQLRSRTYVIEAGRKWYEIWVSHKPELWAFPKVVFPDISASPRFCFDRGGKIVNGNCYWIVAQSETDVEKLLLIQGIANSKLMTKYHDLVFNNKLYSGRRRYLTQYVGKYPLPDVNSVVSAKIIELVKKLNDSTDRKRIRELETAVELTVAEAFGVKADYPGQQN